MSYSPEYFTVRETWRDWRIEAYELIRIARVVRGARVLEIGCGGGGLMRILERRGAQVVGVDTLHVALRLAKTTDNSESTSGKEENTASHDTRHSGQLVQIGENKPLPFPAATFDAILAQHVIEHLPDTDSVLHDWYRLLKPNGRVSLATPNARYPDRSHFADAQHVHIFSEYELSDAVQRAGFVVESSFTLFTFLTRARPLRAFGVIAYNAFRYVPYFSSRGRTIMLAARKI